MKVNIVPLTLLMGLGHLQAGWEAIAPLPEAAAGFVAGCVNQKIIVAGGTNWTGGIKRWLDTIWVFDPEKNVWSIGPKLPHPLAYAARGTHGDRLYFAGGADGVRARDEIYSLDGELKLTRLGRLPLPAVFAGGAVWEGKLHVLGGTPDPDDWTKAHARHQAITLRDGTVEGLGSLEGLDHGIGLPAVAEAGGGLLAFTGAWFDAQQQVHNLDTAFMYRSGWRRVAPYPTAARGVAAVALDGKHVYVAGGHGTDEQGFLAQAWIYDAEADRYQPAVPQPIAATLCLVKCGAFVYALGGEDQKKHRTAVCFRIAMDELLVSP